jgi:flagellar protein FlgJ
MRLISQATLNAAPAKPDLPSTVKHMAGMLWYEMLSELNQSGFSADTLGTGGDDFQGMFLWNVAQNDFGKYDSALTTATLRQVGGTPDEAPAPSDIGLPPPLLQAMQLSDAAASGADDAAAMLAAAPESSAADLPPPSGDLVTQATGFAKAIWPQVTAAAQLLGVPAVAVLAQTALETGWGAAAPGNNLFGVKAAYGQPGTARATHEVIDGILTPQTASFRDYGDTAASISDYVSLIQSGYPSVAGQATIDGFAAALQQGGYATDPSYAAKIVGLSHSALMGQVLKSLGADDEIPNPVTPTKGAP